MPTRVAYGYPGLLGEDSAYISSRQVSPLTGWESLAIVFSSCLGRIAYLDERGGGHGLDGGGGGLVGVGLALGGGGGGLGVRRQSGVRLAHHRLRARLHRAARVRCRAPQRPLHLLRRVAAVGGPIGQREGLLRSSVDAECSLGTRLKAKNIRGVFKVCLHEGHRRHKRGCSQRCEHPGFPGARGGGIYTQSAKPSSCEGRARTPAAQTRRRVKGGHIHPKREAVVVSREGIYTQSANPSSCEGKGRVPWTPPAASASRPSCAPPRVSPGPSRASPPTPPAAPPPASRAPRPARRPPTGRTNQTE
eukprot:1195265-Prorocentrum_minimum.AAC.3